MKGTGRLYQRGAVWWIDYGYRGDRHRESSGSHRRAEAVDLLRRRMEEMGRGQLVGRREESVTFEDLTQIIADDYKIEKRKSADRLQVSLKHLRDYFAMNRALDITTDRVMAYIRVRQDEDAANATIQKELAALKRMFNLAIQAGLVTRKPHIPSVRVDNVRTEFLEAGDLAAVIAELPEDLAMVARFAVLTGWRKREILHLNWRQVDFTAGVVRLEPGTTKNYEGREFPFGALPELDQLLRQQRDRTARVQRETGRVVATVFHRGGRPILSMRGAWKEACKRAGVPGVWFHDLRRTAVRNLERAGVSRSVAMKLTGHKTESVYCRYAIADSAAQAEGVAKLARFRDQDAATRKVVPIGNGTVTAQSGR